MKLSDVGDVSKNPNYTESMLQNSARFPYDRNFENFQWRAEHYFPVDCTGP